MKMLSKMNKAQSKKVTGAVLVEYALLIGLIAIPASFGVYYLGVTLNEVFNAFANSLFSAVVHPFA